MNSSHAWPSGAKTLATSCPVASSRCWRSTNPRLLVLDEATEGLAPLIRDEIWACLDRLRGEGQSVLVVDKYVEKLIALADRHTIVERGRVVWAGSSAELDADHSIWHRYLGL